MPALRGTTGITRGTRVPAGASLPRPSGQATYREAELWPGITWGRSALCSCSWAFRDGIAQVKARSTACDVHVPGRKPGRETAGPLPPAPSDEELLAAIRAGTVTWELYLSSVRSWQPARARLDAERAAARQAVAIAVRQVVALIAEAADQAARDADLSRCGTHKGYNLHLSRGGRACPRCLEAEAEYSAGRKRAQRQAKAATAGREWQEAA